MINESEFSGMFPYEQSFDTVFVHQSFMSMFSGMLNWIGDVLYPRFNYKVITTYDKAVEVFTKKKQNKDGQVQTNFLPALTLDPVLDFSNEERSGRFMWMFKNLKSHGGDVWNDIKLTDQGVTITPMFTRYQGTVEVTGWFTSMYELIDFRTKLIQYCNGYQRWIRPDYFWAHLIIPKEIFEYNGPDGKLDWSAINPEIITLTTTNTKEYALPYVLDAMWRLDSFGDSSNKMGADQIAEYKTTATFTWECNIPTFIRIKNYQYPIEKINLNVGMTPAVAKYPLKVDYSLFRKINYREIFREITNFTPIYNICEKDATPIIKVQDDMCISYPVSYKPYDHYVCGKVYDIEKLESEEDIENIDSILVIEKYSEDILPYVRRCRGLVSRLDTNKSFDLMSVVRDLNISLMMDIKDFKLFNAFKSLHNVDVTFDPIGKCVYKGKHKIKCYNHDSKIDDVVFTHNIVRLIKQFNLKKHLIKEHTMTIGEININTTITDKDNVICEQFSGVENLKQYKSNKIITSACRENITAKINGVETNKFTIDGFNIIFDVDVEIHEGDIISLYRNSDCVQTSIRLVNNYKMTKEDEYNYYYKKQYLEVDISNCRKVDPSTIQCITYKGLLNQTIDFIVDMDNKKIVFKIEPYRDSYIQIFGSPI